MIAIYEKIVVWMKRVKGLGDTRDREGCAQGLNTKLAAEEYPKGCRIDRITPSAFNEEHVPGVKPYLLRGDRRSDGDHGRRSFSLASMIRCSRETLDMTSSE